MRQFEEQTKKVKEVTSIVCNKCGRVIPVIEGVPVLRLNWKKNRGKLC